MLPVGALPRVVRGPFGEKQPDLRFLSEFRTRVFLRIPFPPGVGPSLTLLFLTTLCGLRVSSSQLCRATAELEPYFNSLRNRPLGAQPYLVLDAPV